MKIIVTIIPIMIVIAIPSGIAIYNWGHTPIHRRNIEGIDPLGDVSDSDVDIIHYKSYQSFEWRQNFSSSPYFIIIEITVAGMIKSDNFHKYSFIIVARELSDEIGHIYWFDYIRGKVSENLDFMVENSTLRIYFPVTRFIPNDYMTGLEIMTDSTIHDDGRDYTPEVRDAPIIYRYW